MKYKIDLIDGKSATLIDINNKKCLLSDKYNFIFDKQNGMLIRWGNTVNADASLEYGLPEIADIEISTICSGIEGSGVCNFCYKSNNPNGKYMNLDTFKRIFDKLPPTVTQIAFGIGDLDGNPDMWDIFAYCRENGVIPNITINGEGLTDNYAKLLVKYCGAVSVSLYDKEKTYNAIHKLSLLNLKQINIHALLSEETQPIIYELINDIRNKDYRLTGLNAVVFLSLKQKGRAKNGYNIITTDNFNKLMVEIFSKNEIGIGFDSCSSFKFLKWAREFYKNDKRMLRFIEPSIEPCESSIYSIYISVNGEYYPCSFIENTKNWEHGIDILNTTDFLKDVWYDEKTLKFRESVIDCRNCEKNCPVYTI